MKGIYNVLLYIDINEESFKLMRNSIFLLFTILFAACKTTPEEYSNFPFIGENIKSEKYEMITLIPEGYELRGVYGHQYPSSSDIPGNTEKTLALPFILFEKKLNSIFFFSTKEDKYTPFTIKYNFEKNEIDTIAYNGDTIRELYDKKKSNLTNFTFSEAEKYYKVKIELKDTISYKDHQWANEKYPNNEIKRKEVEKLLTYTYKACFINLQMPEEEIRFKYNLSPNGKILFFGNDELYKKGYIYIYIYKSSNLVPHSGGLYVIRPKEKK